MLAEAAVTSAVNVLVVRFFCLGKKKNARHVGGLRSHPVFKFSVFVVAQRLLCAIKLRLVPPLMAALFARWMRTPRPRVR